MAKEAAPGWDVWTLVFASNLVVPLGFALLITRGAGWIGVAAGAGLLWSVWLRLCAAGEGLGRALIIGGWLVAGTQMCPVLQFSAGVVGVVIGGAIGREPLEPNIQGPVGGFIATITMGALLMGIAASCGAIAAWLFPRRPSERRAIGSPLFDRELDG